MTPENTTGSTLPHADSTTRALTPTQMLYTLKTRRSYGLKNLLPDPIDQSLIETLLDAANWAPSHGHTEPWRFTVFTGEGRRKLESAFARAYRAITPQDKFTEEGLRAASERVWQAPVWISIVMEPDPNKPMPEWEDLIATGLATHNLQLMAGSLGLGTKWTSGAVSNHQAVADLLGVQPPARLLGFIYVGKPQGELLPPKRKPLEHKVKWVTE